MTALCSVPGCLDPSRALGFCAMHYKRTKNGTPMDQPREVRRDPMTRYVVLESGCWQWQGALHNGYGSVSQGGRRTTAHRWFYQQLVGPIPDGLQLDHLCRNRGCVNPEHVEPVTIRENLRRGEHPNMVAWREGRCTKGHAYTEANTWVSPSRGTRHCRKCKAAASRQLRARRRGEAA